MVTEQAIRDIAAQHGGTVEMPSPGFPNLHVKLPNGATVSIGYGPGHYCDARTGITRDIMGPGLPQASVEVAVWHPGIAPMTHDWDAPDDAPLTMKAGELGGMLPENDVHAFQSLGELTALIEYAAGLEVGYDGTR